MSDQPDAGGIAAALNELAEAHHELAGCEAQYEGASRALTSARNRCNNAQKEIDKQLAQIRANAPRGTDWKERPTHHAILGGPA